MGRDDAELVAAKRAYRQAKDDGIRQEEARWANVIGDMMKNRGEYVEALKWLRIDYDVSLKYLPEKQLLPTCQSIGELYFRLEQFNDALVYQKKHLQLAIDADDLVEQQRASTQLGRTYFEMYLNSENEHHSVRKARKYFDLAMDQARLVRENPPNSKSNFVKEYVDTLNNAGMLELELENFGDAKKLFVKGLEICDEEEVGEYDETRTRLHHNLGNLYMQLRMWEKAKDNIEKDIIICKRIKHCQGEAKGYINLGELHYRVHKYEEALRCYRKAFELAKCMEDEDALIRNSADNIKIVQEAMKEMEELRREEQNLKKLARDMVNVRGTPRERKCLLQQSASLDILIEKSNRILAWTKQCEFAKKKKKISIELCDKEKLSDACWAIGESYQKLRKFDKAKKWFTKSLDLYKLIGNIEGQASVKIDIGNVLDAEGDFRGAWAAFEESKRICLEANLPSVQLSALENMHYIQMIRFDDLEKARNLQLMIDELKKSIQQNQENRIMSEDCCSETDTEEDNDLSSNDACHSSKRSKSGSNKSRSASVAEELDDDMSLISIFQSVKGSSKKGANHLLPMAKSIKPVDASPDVKSKSTSDHQTFVGHKRVRVILSDDEDEMECSNGKIPRCRIEDIATSDELKSQHDLAGSKIQASSNYASKCTLNVEESSNSYQSKSINIAAKTSKLFGNLSGDVVVEPKLASSSCDYDINISHELLQDNARNAKFQSSGNDQHISFKINKEIIRLEVNSFLAGDRLNTESLKAELACFYYMQLPSEKRSEGLLPIIDNMKFAGKAVDSFQRFESLQITNGDVIEASVEGWVQKRLIKLYMESCQELSESTNMTLLKKLYNPEVSDDEIVASECELQDLSVTPLLNALLALKNFAVLDLSHNLLGNITMEKLQKVFASSGQTYGGLTLDLHCNRFGPTSLFQICECPILHARLEVLNISGNRLTDACGSYLSTILEKCTGLIYLNIERCCITSRTIQKITDALDSHSLLSQLCIGYNSPISGNTVVSLLAKLSTLRRFSELNLSGLKLGKPVIDTLCQFARTSSLSGLMLGSTGIGMDAAMQLKDSLFNGTQELVKLDLSFCGLTSDYLTKTDPNLFPSLFELNLEGNAIKPEGTKSLSSLLTNPQCRLKVLVLRSCQLGLDGVLQVIAAISENDTLEELNLAGNADPTAFSALEHDFSLRGHSGTSEMTLKTPESSSKGCLPAAVDNIEEGPCTVNAEFLELEVADSEDSPTPTRVEPATSGVDDSCASSCKRNSFPSNCQFVQQLSNAIAMAQHLQLLDLSSNGFSTQAAESFYASWSSNLRAESGRSHIINDILHLSLIDNRCCRGKPCCKRM